MKKLVSIIISILVISSTALASWGNDLIGASEFATKLKKAGKTDEVIVAVIDSGVDASNTNFGNKLLKGYDSMQNLEAWNIGDQNGHGTMMASIIAECTEPLDNVKILPIKALTVDGTGQSNWIAKAVDYAVQKGADVISMSLGWYVPQNAIYGDTSLVTIDILEESIQAAIDKGITVVVAAGNEKADVTVHSPSRMKDAIVVTAVDKSYNFAIDFSNHGRTVDFAAPGVKTEAIGPKNETYLTTGTSPATAYVAAVAALLLVDNKAVSPYNAMVKNAIDLGEYGYDEYFGYGFICLKNADPTKTYSYYIDVPVTSWYYENVYWASDNNIITGYGDATFMPEAPITRAEFTAILSRYKNNYVGNTGMQFTDVPLSMWCNANVAWAVRNGIANGIGWGLFAPNENIKRKDLATMLNRYMSVFNYTWTEIWSGENPDDTASRAEAVTMLRRAVGQ